jgi:ATP-dependent Clp protease ATP-binding subunit ClpA
MDLPILILIKALMEHFVCKTLFLPVHTKAKLMMKSCIYFSSRIVGQTFALEQVLSEVSSYYVNTELSDKPLVMLFSGPPGKTHTLYCRA